MAYATQQDIIDRYGEDRLLILADRDGDGAVDEDVVARALADADSEIDLHVGGRYDLPLSTVPAAIVQVACDIAVYRLSQTDADATDMVRDRFKDARAMLRSIALGQVSLGLVAEKSGGQASGPAIVAGKPRAFGRGPGGGLR